MALRIADRVKETWTGTGTGTMTLGGAVTGFNTFASAFADGVTCYYVIEHASLGAWEIGEGTMGGSGTTLARTSVIASSNANALVSFATGTKMVFCTAPATYIATVSGTLTTGSVPFIDSRGRLIEDNASLSFNDTTNTLSAANATVATNLTVSTMTAGSVLFAGTSGLVSQDNANLFWDNTNKRHGIGTASPVSILHTHSGANANTFHMTNTASGATAADGFEFSMSAAGNATYLWMYENGSMSFATNNLERITITAAGNVGIGQTSPAGLLHVDGAASGVDLFLTNNATGHTGSDGFNLGVNAGSTGAYIWNYENTEIDFATNNLMRMKIAAGGNVGINQTSPLSLLDVAGAIGTAINTITADTTIDGTYSTIINNKAGSTCTLTLPAAASFSRRKYLILNHQAFTVVSATTNVVPIAGGAAAAAILAATTGKWAVIQSDGTNWNIIASN